MSTPYILALFEPNKDNKYYLQHLWEHTTVGIEPKPIKLDNSHTIYKLSSLWKRVCFLQKRYVPIFDYVDGEDLIIKPIPMKAVNFKVNK